MVDNRVELRGYTHYGTGLNDPADIVSYAEKIGLKGIGITDIGVVAGFLDAYVAESNLKQSDFRLIYGIQVKMQEKLYDDEELEGLDDIKRCSCMVTILIKNETGRRNLYRMITECSWRQKIPYGCLPVVEKGMIEKYRDGLLIGYSCDNERFPVIDFFDYVEIAPLDYIFPDPHRNFYKLEDVQKYIKRLIAFAEEHHKPAVVVSAFQYLREGEEELWRNLQYDRQFSDGIGTGMINCEGKAHLRTTEKLLAEFSFLGKEKTKKVVVDNTILIAEMIHLNKPLEIQKQFPLIEDADTELRSLVMKLSYIQFGDPLPSDIKDRLRLELKVIQEKESAELFLLNRELIMKLDLNHYAGLCGAGNNSLVGYVLGIERVNPLQYHLPFELFRNNTRDAIYVLQIPYEKKEDLLCQVRELRGVSDAMYGGCVENYRESKFSKIFLIPEKDKKERECAGDGSLLPRVYSRNGEWICGTLGYGMSDYFRSLYVDFGNNICNVRPQVKI